MGSNTPNISRDFPSAWHPEKRYREVTIQQGPVSDWDLNEAQWNILYEMYLLSAASVGLKVRLYGAFEISEASPNVNDFAIEAGAAYVYGAIPILEANTKYRASGPNYLNRISEGIVTAIDGMVGSITDENKKFEVLYDLDDCLVVMLTGDEAGSTRVITAGSWNETTLVLTGGIGNIQVGDEFVILPRQLTTPLAPRTDIVYLAVWHEFINSEEDAEIEDPYLLIETSQRMKLRWCVRVAEGGVLPPDTSEEDLFNFKYLQLATIERTASSSIQADMITVERDIELSRKEVSNEVVDARTGWWFDLGTTVSLDERLDEIEQRSMHHNLGCGVYTKTGWVPYCGLWDYDPSGGENDDYSVYIEPIGPVAVSSKVRSAPFILNKGRAYKFLVSSKGQLAGGTITARLITGDWAFGGGVYTVLSTLNFGNGDVAWEVLEEDLDASVLVDTVIGVVEITVDGIVAGERIDIGRVWMLDYDKGGQDPNLVPWLPYSDIQGSSVKGGIGWGTIDGTNGVMSGFKKNGVYYVGHDVPTIISCEAEGMPYYLPSKALIDGQAVWGGCSVKFQDVAGGIDLAQLKLRAYSADGDILAESPYTSILGFAKPDGGLVSPYTRTEGCYIWFDVPVGTQYIRPVFKLSGATPAVGGYVGLSSFRLFAFCMPDVYQSFEEDFISLVYNGDFVREADPLVVLETGTDVTSSLVAPPTKTWHFAEVDGWLRTNIASAKITKVAGTYYYPPNGIKLTGQATQEFFAQPISLAHDNKEWEYGITVEAWIKNPSVAMTLELGIMSLDPSGGGITYMPRLIPQFADWTKIRIFCKPDPTRPILFVFFRFSGAGSPVAYVDGIRCYTRTMKGLDACMSLTSKEKAALMRSSVALAPLNPVVSENDPIYLEIEDHAAQHINIAHANFIPVATDVSYGLVDPDWVSLLEVFTLGTPAPDVGSVELKKLSILMENINIEGLPRSGGPNSETPKIANIPIDRMWSALTGHPSIYTSADPNIRYLTTDHPLALVDWWQSTMGNMIAGSDDFLALTDGHGSATAPNYGDHQHFHGFLKGATDDPDKASGRITSISQLAPGFVKVVSEAHTLVGGETIVIVGTDNFNDVYTPVTLIDVDSFQIPFVGVIPAAETKGVWTLIASLHKDAIPSVLGVGGYAGFMSAVDKERLDGTGPLSDSLPNPVAALGAASAGIGIEASRWDHEHEEQTYVAVRFGHFTVGNNCPDDGSVYPATEVGLGLAMFAASLQGCGVEILPNSVISMTGPLTADVVPIFCKGLAEIQMVEGAVLAASSIEGIKFNFQSDTFATTPIQTDFIKRCKFVDGTFGACNMVEDLGLIYPMGSYGVEDCFVSACFVGKGSRFFDFDYDFTVNLTPSVKNVDFLACATLNVGVSLSDTYFIKAAVVKDIRFISCIFSHAIVSETSRLVLCETLESIYGYISWYTGSDDYPALFTARRYASSIDMQLLLYHAGAGGPRAAIVEVMGGSLLPAYRWAVTVSNLSFHLYPQANTVTYFAIVRAWADFDFSGGVSLQAPMAITVGDVAVELLVSHTTGGNGNVTVDAGQTLAAAPQTGVLDTVATHTPLGEGAWVDVLDNAGNPWVLGDVNHDLG